jgi:RHH-type proline utilization regulon transcriptional repressor/proline dehydrogenase/delta 1-pyrroline-5-carboxylate dehydrogenase
MAHNLARLGKGAVAKAFPPAIRAGIRAGALAPIAPHLAAPLAQKIARRLVGHLVVDARSTPLQHTVQSLARKGFACNINLLGEAVLGDAEADRRLTRTQELLSRPYVDYVSLKVSAVASGLTPWGYAEGVERLVTRLTPVYDAAAAKATPAFINLDMEEYHDLRTTIEVFTRILSESRFLGLRAGIVIQAYLPDALEAMQKLQEFAAERVAAGGAPIKVRLVKGANLPMERVDAALHEWPLATHRSKAQSDAHYKRLLLWALTPERVANVQIGVAGHNLFDIAFAHLLAQDRGVSEGLDFEMLLGMAPSQATRVQQDVGTVRLYVPVVYPKDFDSAMSYLVRRLEEAGNSANIMSALDSLGASEELFTREKERFEASVELLAGTVPTRNRKQDRAHDTPPVTLGRASFHNCSDTDASTPENQAWARGIVARVAQAHAGPDALAQYRPSTVEQIDTAVATARAARSLWASRTATERADVLRRVGTLLEERRGALLEVMATDASKVLSESDTEVSEAIDFSGFYAMQAEALEAMSGARFEPAGLTVVTPPWNFPLAIPAGSTLAALAAGSSVILKPAPQVENVSAALAECLWDAGVPRDAMQLVLAPETEVGRRLVSHPDVDRVVLTGAFETAAMFRSWRADLRLLAETSGKNGMVITPSADVDLAVADLVQSAFGHAGQKCSAASLAILVGSMGTSERFFRQLEDATRSLIVDQPTNLEARVGPLVEPPGEKLHAGLTQLGENESWLVEPRQLDEEGRLFTPGIRVGVRRGAQAHRTEFFGPVLSIMRAESLAEAVDLQNDTNYGLTAGLHSLDTEELRYWLEHVEAGNLYVNRGITGAIVRRQPFGGWKRSAVGPGSKAGGPHYLWGFGTWQPQPLSGRELAGTRQYDTATMLDTPAGSVVKAAREHLGDDEATVLGAAYMADEREFVDMFGVVVDVAGLGVERNLVRYRPTPVAVRVGANATVPDMVRVVIAGLAARGTFTLSSQNVVPLGLRRAIEDAGVKVSEEGHDTWLDRLGRSAVTRVRAIGVDGRPLRAQLDSDSPVTAYEGPVTLASGPEMLPFLHEQSVTITAHRYGNLHRWSEEVIPSQARRD